MDTKENLNAFYPVEENIPQAFRLISPIHQRSMLINGELQLWSGETREIRSPILAKTASGGFESVVLGSVPVAGIAEAESALAAAISAYDEGRGHWPTFSVAERIACVEEFTRQIQKRREEIVNLIMWEIGKSLPDSQKEFDRTILYIKDTIHALKKLDNENSRFQIVEGTIAQIRRSPLGVTLCLGPYNYPLNETFTTLIPALIMGNVVLLKPPKYGTLLYYPMLEAFRSAFPAGVINTIYGKGSEIVPHLMASGKINVLAQIGSSRVADQLKKAHPKSNRLRAVLGLDAKNAAIILPDADVDLAVKECIAGSLSFNGQRCTALKILFVHQSIAETFLRKFTDAVEKLKVGMPWESGVMITPLPDPDKCHYLSSCIQDAEANGAKVLNPSGGKIVGNIFFPAVVFPVKPEMKLYREEQFGPIVPVGTFEDVTEVLDYIVTSDYGQQVSLFGTNPTTIAKLVDPLVNQVCRVNINCQCQRGPDIFPFAGRKDSAEGTLSVHDALRAFSIRTMVALKETDQSKKMLDAIVLSHESSFINTRFIL
ncbi:NADP-dependent glyceraldehyde-3-phosphate dehydrogenase [Leeia sp. TBRC 13508]|uniref:NADP-dependent glyceraldehyde-3-phosphate dehydrogenase n=1 Tax=Leeia speluncae TaxID=2884804 RepID=A0ABS8D820_9NEIS|nr:NADP-dependent glyceraldehyde-3-phosphate dehydrogenase [Leeia speluncae]MCB6184343.1 NADP-dependent glyceraldehyde-3-phosphate dehydrogenase [Leeia speluncae]